jgi:hypothetical protein
VSDNYRDGCSGRRYGKVLVSLVTFAAWLVNLGRRR